jgi:prophage DNA circulation protein
MAWLDQLRPASFRGVPFQVDTVDVSAGDNVVLREYPFQDLPTVFRMGEAAEEIKLSAYVIGDDYDEQRDALRQVLSGEGVLIHPTAGSIRCFVAGKYQIKEAPTAEGGMARFDLVFVRAQPRRYPVGATNNQADARAKASAAKKAASAAFAAQWSLTGQPGWVADRAVARIGASLDETWKKLADASKTLGDFNSETIGNYQALRTGLDDLLSTPRQLGDNIATLFELPGELTNASARDLQAAFQWVFNVKDRIASTDFEVIVMPAVGAGLVIYGTGNAAALAVDSATRAQLARLTAASDQLIEGLATAAWVEAATWAELSNYDDVMAMRNAVSAQLTRLLTDASAAPATDALPDSSWHDAMLALYTSALADLQARSRDLVRLTSYTPQGWEPVWLISYRLFGTADYADEILAMNPHIEHPLLVPPGKALRIVRHD